MPAPRLLSAAAAAEARAAEIRTPADRPSARRNGPAADTPARVRTPLSRLELRASSAGDHLVTFDGIACAYERSYEMWDFFGPYTEVVSAGAGAATLSRSPDVVFLLNHGGMTLARTKSGTLTLTEEEEGLHPVAELDRRISVVNDIVTSMERGDLDEMSFAFRITRGQWSPDYTEYRIDEYDIDRGDVSIVNYGANPHTSAALRSEQLLAAIEELDGPELVRAQTALAARAATLQTPAGAMTAEELEAIARELAPHPLAGRFA